MNQSIVNMIIGFIVLISSIFNMTVAIKNRKMTKILLNEFKKIQIIHDLLEIKIEDNSQ